jgi:hypothetical protein
MPTRWPRNLARRGSLQSGLRPLRQASSPRRLRRRERCRRLAVIVLIALCASVRPVRAQPSPGIFVDRPLEAALRVLQARGLRLVFTSEMVTPDMRVRVEPRAGAPKDQLAELLQPHGLTAESGPGGVLQIVRQKKSTVERSHRAIAPAPVTRADADDLDERASGAVYRERVTVFGDVEPHDDRGAGVERRLALHELRGLGSQIADDPLRTVQALPGVTTGDDFRSDYSVRGSQYRHAGILIDGVIAPWLQHAALGRGDTGSLTMLRGDVIQEAALQVGAYPRLDSSQLGPQLNLTLREGSRAARRFALGVSGTSATLTAEGPIGSAAAVRGAWLVGVRSSHSEWPIGRNDHDTTVFGFRDLQSKVVYDVRPDQQVSLTIIAGMSNVEREDPGLFAPADGLNRAAMVALAWRSVIGGRAVVTQRVSALAHDFLNHSSQAAPTFSRGANGANGYRVDVSQPLLGAVVDTGVHIRQVRGSRHGPAMSDLSRALDPGPTLAPEPTRALEQTLTLEPAFLDDVGASWFEQSAHASVRRAVSGAVTLAAGLRLSDSTLVRRRALDRWVQAEWALAPQWLLHASTVVAHQFPALEMRAGWTRPADLRPERATSIDVGISQRLSGSLHWTATVFSRRERDAFRDPDLHPRVILADRPSTGQPSRLAAPTDAGASETDGHLTMDDATRRFENALTGSARGFELTMARRSRSGLSGWFGYSYGVARYTDAARQETFAADFDQRHAINLSGLAPLPGKTRLGLIFRGGTNVPLSGYLVRRDGRLFAASERNRERLPAYARLDLRAERTFDRGSRRVTAFVDVLNVLNRMNVGPTDGTIARDTGEAIGFTERLFPRVLTAGLRFEF